MFYFQFKIKGVKTSGWVAFTGDLLHKIADGIAIGACNIYKN